MKNPGINTCNVEYKKYDNLRRKLHGGFVPVLKTLPKGGLRRAKEA
jgi:hypothetical protein